MARKVMTKEVTLTQLTLCEVNAVGGSVEKSEAFMHKVAGKMNETQIAKYLAKEFKGRHVLVLDSKEVTKHYRMDIKKFLEMAEEYEPRKIETTDEEL